MRREEEFEIHLFRILEKTSSHCHPSVVYIDLGPFWEIVVAVWNLDFSCTACSRPDWIVGSRHVIVVEMLRMILLCARDLQDDA